MKKFNFKERLRYKFDSMMSRGAPSLIGPLAVASIIFMLIMALLFWILNIFPGRNVIQLIGISIMRTINAESMNEASTNIIYTGSMVIIGIVSIFFVSVLIGLLTTTMEGKIRSLRKGRSVVLEENHTVILGWSEMIFTVISELIDASNHTKKRCVVILSNKDKTEMEDLIKERISYNRNVRIICRQGNPIDIDDLKIVSINTASSIIILNRTDSNVIKSVLAIINSKKESGKPYHIVAAIDDYKNIAVAKIAGKSHCDFIQAKDFISRIIAQTSLQPGLSIIYTELLNFEGDEIYFYKCEELAGKSFKDALFMSEKSSLIGLYKDGMVKLNPPMDTVIAKDDEAIFISESEESIKISNSAGDHDIRSSAINISRTRSGPKRENILILGWNEKIFKIIEELDKYLAKGSSLTVVTGDNKLNGTLEKELKGLTNNSDLKFLQANIQDHDILQELILNNYSHILVLTDDTKDMQEADADSIMIIIHLRNIAEKNNLNFSLITEIVDIRNMRLAKIARVNDLIISERLISLFLVQLSENKLVNHVFEDFMNETGAEIYIREAKDYINLNEEVNLYTIIEAASRKNEVVIGYKIVSEESNEEKSFGVFLNPVKSAAVKFSKGDSIIVIAED